MTVRSWKMDINVNILNSDGTIATLYDGTPATAIKGRDGARWPWGTCVALGNGYFLTAAHNFDHWERSSRADDEKDLTKLPLYDRQFVTKEVYIGDATAKDTWKNIRNWNAYETFKSTYLQDGQSKKYPVNDIAYFTINYKVSNADLSNFAIFANNDTVNKHLKDKTVTQYGQTSTTSGAFEETSVDGQFRAFAVTQPGDSGGPAACQIGKQEYVVGITSLGDQVDTTFSYLKPKEFMI